MAPAAPAAPAPAERTPAPAPPSESKPLLQRIERLTERAALAEPAHHGSAISQALDEVMEVIDALKQAGAEGILVIPIEKMVS